MSTDTVLTKEAAQDFMCPLALDINTHTSWTRVDNHPDLVLNCCLRNPGKSIRQRPASTEPAGLDAKACMNGDGAQTSVCTAGLTNRSVTFIRLDTARFDASP